MSSKGQLTVPKAVREALGIGEGDEVGDLLHRFAQTGVGFSEFYQGRIEAYRAAIGGEMGRTLSRRSVADARLRARRVSRSS